MAAISVIIPVYQVEKYIRRCLDSLLAQTFSDFEAILVDDGSTDQSGAICEEYARKDPRFVVFHQKNQGQSVARNYALDWVYANSDSRYISFVDSDDWVHPKYLELLYEAITRFSVKISQCGIVRTTGPISEHAITNKMFCVTADDAYANWFTAYFWGKLYHKSCFESLRFPVGQIFEDVAIWYKLLFSLDQIAIVDEPLHYYYQRQDGATNSVWTPKKLPQIDAWAAQLEFASTHGSMPVLNQALRRCCGVLRNQLSEIQRSNAISIAEKERYSKQLRKKLKDILRQYESELKHLGIYSDYFPLAHPVRIKLYHLLTGFKNPRKLLTGCKNGFLRMISKPTILFESVPDFADNTRPVYDEMVRRGLGKRFCLVWEDRSGEPVILNADGSVTSILRDLKPLKRRIRLWSLCNRTTAIVCCNRLRFPTDPTKTTVFYLSHGTPMKSTRNYYTDPGYIDYAFAASEQAAPICSREFNISLEKFAALGFPRNDVFAEAPVDIRPMLNTDCAKVIVWYPTYRQQKDGKQTACAHALPIIYDQQAAIELDRAAAACSTLLVLKPHFAQDVSLIRDLGLKHIRFIDDSFFIEHKISSYRFVNSCDAMITDYSSIYFDYLLADKPVAVTWDDLEEYRKDPGFAVDLDVYMNGAVKVYNVEELISFVRDVAAGRDTLKAERRVIRDTVNYSTDGKNTERVVDFILDKLIRT